MRQSESRLAPKAASLKPQLEKLDRNHSFWSLSGEEGVYVAKIGDIYETFDDIENMLNWINENI